MPILEILEANLRVMGQRGTSVLCICGWHAEALGKRSEDLHRAHMAEVLEEHMREREASAKANALEEAAENLENHPRLRKSQFAWALYPEHMAATEKTFHECAQILRGRAAELRGSR